MISLMVLYVIMGLVSTALSRKGTTNLDLMGVRIAFFLSFTIHNSNLSFGGILRMSSPSLQIAV